MLIVSSVDTGAAMAAAWVTLKHLGQDGYMKIAQKLQDTVKILIDGANSIKVCALLIILSNLYCTIANKECLIELSLDC